MKTLFTASVLLLGLITLQPCLAMNTAKPSPVIIGYVGGYKGQIINTNAIAASKLTHINYAFVNVVHNRAILSNGHTDSINLIKLVALKKKSPSLKILISLGGWSWSGNFSDAVLTDTSRRAFAASALQLLQYFKLDGIDIDWEYPDMTGSGNVHRKEDKQNYTLMFKELRRQLDIESKKSHRKLLLTTATGGFKGFLEHTEMDKAHPYLDYINLMTYDYYGNGSAIHHSNLYGTPTNENGDSADKAVNDYIAAGLPVSKLVMGIAFYGRGFQLDNTATRGLGDPVVSSLRGWDYVLLKDSMINKNGFISYRDTVAKAPYLFNTLTKQFITYEDEWSVLNKCKYVMDKKMAGVMFWEYDADPQNILLNQINTSLK